MVASPANMSRPRGGPRPNAKPAPVAGLRARTPAQHFHPLSRYPSVVSLLEGACEIAPGKCHQHRCSGVLREVEKLRVLTAILRHVTEELGLDRPKTFRETKGNLVEHSHPEPIDGNQLAFGKGGGKPHALILKHSQRQRPSSNGSPRSAPGPPSSNRVRLGRRVTLHTAPP